MIDDALRTEFVLVENHLPHDDLGLDFDVEALDRDRGPRHWLEGH